MRRTGGDWKRDRPRQGRAQGGGRWSASPALSFQFPRRSIHKSSRMAGKAVGVTDTHDIWCCFSPPSTVLSSRSSKPGALTTSGSLTTSVPARPRLHRGEPGAGCIRLCGRSDSVVVLHRLSEAFRRFTTEEVGTFAATVSPVSRWRLSSRAVTAYDGMGAVGSSWVTARALARQPSCTRPAGRRRRARL